MTMTTKKNNFEEELTQLQKIVNNLENGNVPLEDALDEFQAGVKLSRDLNKRLTEAEETVAKLINLIVSNRLTVNFMVAHSTFTSLASVTSILILLC